MAGIVPNNPCHVGRLEVSCSSFDKAYLIQDVMLDNCSCIVLPSYVHVGRLFRVSQRAVKIEKDMHAGEACGLGERLAYDITRLDLLPFLLLTSP